MNCTYLESKHASIQAYRGPDDFYFEWREKDLCVVAEYIPTNWPAFTLRIFDKGAKVRTLSEARKYLKKVGYAIEK